MTGNGILYHDEGGDAVSDQGGLEHVALAFNSNHMVHPKNNTFYQKLSRSIVSSFVMSSFCNRSRKLCVIKLTINLDLDLDLVLDS